MNDTTPMTTIPRKRGLGRGLDALFEDTELRVAPTPTAVANDEAVVAPVAPTLEEAGSVPSSSRPRAGRATLNIAQLVPGQFQPRHHFNDDTIHQLAQSIAQHGIIQPLLVRPLPGSDGKYEIIAGERRWRAAQKAQLHDVPVIINDGMTDRDALQLGLIENLQREDLNAIDEALGYQRLLDEFHFTPERLGEMIGKSRSHIVNTMRLLQLPEVVRDMLVGGRLSAGHARALIGLPNAVELAEKAAEGLSVRETEGLAATARAVSGQGGKRSKKGVAKPGAIEKDMHILAFEKDMTDALGLKVTFDLTSLSSGTMNIAFRSLEQLDGVVKRLISGR